MAGKGFMRLPSVPSVLPWFLLSALLIVGATTSLKDLMHLPLSQTREANLRGQRFVANPMTGEILMEVRAKGAKGDGFDVAKPSEKPAEPPTEKPASTPETAPTQAADANASTSPAKPADASMADENLPASTPLLRTTPSVEAELTMPAHSKNSLVRAPAPEVTETVDGMQLPKRGDKDASPAKLYARPFRRNGKQVPLSFVVMDAGVDVQSIGLLMNLPPEVSVAYSPYARGNNYSEHLRAAGHEVWTMLPAMSEHYPNDDPGPMGVIAKMPTEEITRRVQMVMAAVPGSVGLVMPANENISTQKDGVLPILSEVEKRGMLLASTHPTRSLEQFTKDPKLSAILRRADLILDEDADESQIRSKLAGVLDSAMEKGEYLVVMSARPQSLNLLKDWLSVTKVDAPVVLAPLSALYQPKDAPEVKAEDEGGHGSSEKKEEKPKPKPKKALPQDQYLKPAGEKEGGGHGGGH